jgi:hypothetical protein
MTLPTEPVTLTVAQIEDLNRQLSEMRHDIKNNLTLIQAAVELIRTDPQSPERKIVAMLNQPKKISDAIQKFSLSFEATFGIARK